MHARPIDIDRQQQQSLPFNIDAFSMETLQAGPIGSCVLLYKTSGISRLPMHQETPKAPNRKNLHAVDAAISRFILDME